MVESQLAEALEALSLVDHHVHGVFSIPVDRPAFEQAITESDRPLPPDTTQFDSQVGFAVLRWCAPVLGLEPHSPAEVYLQRRAQLGPDEVNRRLLRSSGVSRYLLDTGYAQDQVLDVAGMAVCTGAECREVVRLEALAEEVVRSGTGAGAFATAFHDLLRERIAAGAVATKSILAYRHGFDLDLSRPGGRAVTDAASRWLSAVEATGRVRLSDPTILAFAVWAGVDAGLPLQLHTGLGDTDLDLGRANPMLLTGFLRETEKTGIRVLLLHCYPFHREAGYLAQVFPHVFFDVGLALHYVGAQSARIVAESLELAPFTKQLFSSDGWGPAELHHLGARLWRRAMASVLATWVDGGDWSLAGALRVASLIGAENAERVYALAP